MMVEWIAPKSVSCFCVLSLYSTRFIVVNCQSDCCSLGGISCRSGADFDCVHSAAHVSVGRPECSYAPRPRRGASAPTHSNGVHICVDQSCAVLSVTCGVCHPAVHFPHMRVKFTALLSGDNSGSLDRPNLSKGQRFF